MSIASGINLDPAIFGLTTISLQNDYYVDTPSTTYTTTPQTAYTTPTLPDGTYLVMASAVVIYSSGSSGTPQNCIISISTGGGTDIIQPYFQDFAEYNSVNVSGIISLSSVLGNTISVVVEAQDYTTNWTLENVKLSYVKIA